MSWSSTHAGAAALCVKFIPEPITALCVAFISHFLLDYVGEVGYKSLLEAAAMEGSMLLIYGLAALTSATPWLFILAWVAGNLPDIIDNFRMLVLKKKKWFPCHNGTGEIKLKLKNKEFKFKLFQFKIKDKLIKLGYPVLIQLNYSQTVTMNIVMTIVAVLTMLL